MSLNDISSIMKADISGNFFCMRLKIKKPKLRISNHCDLPHLNQKSKFGGICIEVSIFIKISKEESFLSLKNISNFLFSRFWPLPAPITPRKSRQ